VYFTSSLLANWDKKGEDNEQYFKAYGWDGNTLQPTFAIDFIAEKLGRPHQMRFGAYALYGGRDESPESARLAAAP
jgi:selenium-binding protein 1